MKNFFDEVPEVLRPLLPEVFASLRETLAQARAALDAGDAGGAGGARLASHSLKGAAMRFGLDALAVEASRAEEHAGAGQLPEAGQALDAFAAGLSLREEAWAREGAGGAVPGE